MAIKGSRASAERPSRLEKRAEVRKSELAQARLGLTSLKPSEYREKGLTADQVQERILAGLTNRQDSRTSRSLIHILQSNLLTLFNAVVGGSFILLLVLGQWRDALFGFAVVANVLIGIIQEYSSKRTLDKLSLLNQSKARVLRDGETVLLDLEDLVVDDLLVLRPGDQVLADAEVTESASLELNESLLTGESEPVDKPLGAQLLTGSGVIAGAGRARVTRIGPETYASRITLEARRFSLVNSELKNALARVIVWVTWALIPLTAIIINGQMQAAGGWAHAIDTGVWLEAAIGSIASIIAMVPQGLVLVTSIAFAMAAYTLARRRILVQELAAVEVLARVDVICFDKTGTLTEGEMVFDSAVELVTNSPENAAWQSVLAHFGADPDANATARCLREQFETDESLNPTASVPFNSERKWSAFAFGQPATQTWVLGAPELVLRADSGAQTSALKQASELADSGRRVLVLARSSQTLAGSSLPADLEAVALLCFKEKIRGDAKDTLRYFAEQGVSVRILSGDNHQTVAAVARDAGLANVGVGFDARSLPETQEELARVLEQHIVFGRVTPDQKRNMVSALQSRGHVVAMTGDGVNDALALKRADLSIAMGTGAAATKAVSSLILLDGKFALLPGVVDEGRRVIANIERLSRLFLTKTVWAMMLALVFGLMLWNYPFLPRQLSALDGFTIGLPSFALALLPNSRRYMPGLLRRSLMFCVPSGLLIGAGVISLSIYMDAFGGYSIADAQTSISLLLAAAGTWVLSSLARPLRNWSLAIVAAMYVVGAVVFLFAPIRDFFGFTSLNGQQLLAPAVASLIVCTAIEVIHLIVKRQTSRIVS